MPLSDEDRKFAADVLNASLTLMSILVAVITFLAIEYKRVESDSSIAEPIHNAVVATTVASLFAGALAFFALIHLRSERGSTAILALAFGSLIAIMTVGIGYVGWKLIT